MQMSNRGFLGFIKRARGRLAIGQILREEFVYELHGPFVAAVPVQARRPLSGRLVDRLSALTSGLPHRSRRATL